MDDVSIFPFWSLLNPSWSLSKNPPPSCILSSPDLCKKVSTFPLKSSLKIVAPGRKTRISPRRQASISVGITRKIM